MLTKSKTTPFKNAGNYFLVQVGIGDLNQYVYLNLDTAVSPLTWRQCQNLHTYKRIPYNSSYCKYPVFRQQDGVCMYNVNYPNGGSAIGVAFYDKFQFLTVKNTTTIVNKITFGCTTESNNINLGPGSGILAMNKSPESLIAQISNLVGGRFSYCLFSNPFIQGYLRFGNDIIIKNKSKIHTVSLVHHLYYPYAYALDLVDISLGSLKLQVHKDPFGNPRKNTGFLIDTNTVLSSIHRATYIRIRKVLADRFDKFRLKKISFSTFDLCYEMRSELKLEHVIVPITFHFKRGANLKVAPEKLFLLNKEKNCFCLGLMPTDGPTVLGAMQQHDTRFVYDIEKGKISFSPEDCVDSEKSIHF